MQHHDWRLDAFGEFKRLERVLDGQFALARAFVGKFVEIRRGLVHAHRQRAKIVQAGNLDFARLHRLEDAGHQADADAVAQLRIFKAQVADFAQHRAAIRVTVGIPAG